MQEKIHPYDFVLPPITPEQRVLKKKIEHNIDQVSPEEYDTYALERNRDKFALMCKDLLVDILNPEKIYQTLEIGAGTGIITNRLNELENLKVVALDNREDFLQYAIEKGRINKDQAIVGDFHELPFKDDVFDLYTGTAILVQRNEITKFYSEAKRVLKDSGLIFLPLLNKKLTTLEKEKENFTKFSIKILQESPWFLLGQVEKNK